MIKNKLSQQNIIFIKGNFMSPFVCRGWVIPKRENGHSPLIAKAGEATMKVPT